MKRILLLLSFVFSVSVGLYAQNDATCDTILKIYNTLGAKEKTERSKYKTGAATTHPGTLGDVSVYKSSISVPGFSEPVFIEGGGEGRRFSTYKETDSYEAAVKLWDELNKKMHTCFTSTWTFVETNDVTELYKKSEITRDGSMFAPTIRYRIERSETKFRLVLDILY